MQPTRGGVRRKEGTEVTGGITKQEKNGVMLRMVCFYLVIAPGNKKQPMTPSFHDQTVFLLSLQGTKTKERTLHVPRLA